MACAAVVVTTVRSERIWRCGEETARILKKEPLVKPFPGTTAMSGWKRVKTRHFGKISLFLDTSIKLEHPRDRWYSSRRTPTHGGRSSVVYPLRSTSSSTDQRKQATPSVKQSSTSKSMILVQHGLPLSRPRRLTSAGASCDIGCQCTGRDDTWIGCLAMLLLHVVNSDVQGTRYDTYVSIVLLLTMYPSAMYVPISLGQQWRRGIFLLQCSSRVACALCADSIRRTASKQRTIQVAAG